MQENYINIYSRYLSELGKTGQADLPRIYELMRIFAPYLEVMHTRADLTSFINRHLQSFPELNTLKQRLADPSYEFPPPPEE